ncbi:MAG TPA: secretin N-terminal domain-containing protein, partial [bacterium]|nr:secretin N-terminal domain-containing protein [bacterium]
MVTSTELAEKLVSAYLDGVEPEEAIDAILFANGLSRQKLPQSDVYIVRAAQARPEPTAVYQGECLPLKHARARDVLETLRTLGYEKTVAVDNRLNSLVIRDYPERIAELKYLVSRLDQDYTASSIKVRVFQLKHIDALDLWVLLPTLVRKNIAAGKEAAIKTTIEVTGTPTGEGKVQAAGTTGAGTTGTSGTSSGTSGGTTSTAADITTSMLGGRMVSFGTGRITEKTTLTSELGDGFSIIPDKRNNALVVVGTEDFLKEVGEIIGILDKPVPQISIEAVLVELTNEGLKDIGVKWGDGSGSLGKVTADYFYGIPLAPGKDTKASAEVSFQSLTADLRLLESRGEANILANPRVTTLNNSPATIRIISTIPVAPRITETTEAGTRTIEYEF